MGEEHGVIAQVQLPSNELSAELPKKFILDLRSRRLKVDRQRLLSLPESILYSLSGGIIWDNSGDGIQPGYVINGSDGTDAADGADGAAGEGVDNEPLDVIAVDLNPDLFEYVLDFFNKADRGLEPATMPVNEFGDRYLQTPVGMDSQVKDVYSPPDVDTEIDAYEARDHQSHASNDANGHHHSHNPFRHSGSHIKSELSHFIHHEPLSPVEPVDTAHTSLSNGDSSSKLPRSVEAKDSAVVAPARPVTPPGTADQTNRAEHSDQRDKLDQLDKLEHLDLADNDDEYLTVPEIIRKRPSIVSLREDLEYYCLLPHNLASDSGPRERHDLMQKIRLECGRQLTNSNLLFTGLKDKDHLDSPEYHLMQMLCMAGFHPDTTWNYRSREPIKSCIVSMHLLRISPPANNDDQSIVEALQKLLLFWRKPAKKCWWDKLDLEIPGVGKIGVHARRVWTLELSILGVD